MFIRYRKGVASTVSGGKRGGHSSSSVHDPTVFAIVTQYCSTHTDNEGFLEVLEGQSRRSCRINVLR